MTPDPAKADSASSVTVTDAAAADVPGRHAAARGGLIDAIVAATDPRQRRADDRLERFLQAQQLGQALREWFGGQLDADKDRLVRRLNQDVARIDTLLDGQINAILHHPQFQKLEASWRGLEYLTNRMDREGEPSIKVKVLTATWRELERDFERALEFDQSEIFKKVYEQEFGMPGGEPYGAIIADYEIHPTPSAAHPHDDLAVLRSLARVAAAAFCPVLTNASPAMFGLDGYDEMEHTINHARTFEQKTYLNWRSFRDSEDARFVGLTMPRVLMRTPYGDDGTRVDRFCFHEDVSGLNHDKYLWGGAAFAMGEVLIRAFATAGWLADIRGLRRDVEQGGLVTGLPIHSFSTDPAGIAPKSSTDVVVTDELEKQLSDLGFIPLCHCKDSEYSVFFSNQSTQKPKRYDEPAASVNARISSMLQYMLCVSRFAHYVKVLGREKTGSFTEAGDFEDYLHRWIVKYVTADNEATPEIKARHPLRDAQVKVHPVPGKPGVFNCTMHLSPHYELDELHATVRLQAELTPPKPG